MSSASELNPPVRDPSVEETRLPTRVLQNWMNQVARAIPTYNPLNVLDFGARGNGIADDTAAFQKAVDQAAHQNGAQIIIPMGTYMVGTITFPSGNAPIQLIGLGELSILKRNVTLPPGVGLLDILGSNVTLDGFVIDGDVTVPVGLFYNADFMGIGGNDPMADSLTRNSSIWLHGGTSNFVCQRVTIQHTGGYAGLIDAGQVGIRDVRFLNCRLQNNRPNLFGIPGGQPIYGSWTGGIYCNGDGRPGHPGAVVKQFLVTQCQFTRNTGNQIWQHLYGLQELHEDFQVYENFLEDIGLDGILIGGVVSGNVSNNVLHRIGYTTSTDTDNPVPRWLAGVQATAIDTSGLAMGVNYQGNVITSVNGGALDLDGHADSSLVGNTVRIPVVGDPDYVTDSIAISGFANTGSTSYGINVGNTANDPRGGKNVTMSGNTLLNLSAGAIRIYSARNCLVTANDIVAPDQPVAPPMSYGPGGTGVNQQPSGNVIRYNRVQYNPPIAAPVVFEDPSVGPFTGADVNYVYGNTPIIGAGGLAFEFQKDPNSGSPTYLQTVWFQ